MAEEVRLRPYRLRPHKENYIRGSDMVTVMSGKWNELWKIKTGEIGRVDLSNKINFQIIV